MFPTTALYFGSITVLFRIRHPLRHRICILRQINPVPMISSQMLCNMFLSIRSFSSCFAKLFNDRFLINCAFNGSFPAHQVVVHVESFDHLLNFRGQGCSDRDDRCTPTSFTAPSAPLSPDTSGSTHIDDYMM